MWGEVETLRMIIVDVAPTEPAIRESRLRYFIFTTTPASIAFHRVTSGTARRESGRRRDDRQAGRRVLGSFNNLAPSFSDSYRGDYIPWINILTRSSWGPESRRAKEVEKKKKKKRKKERNKLRTELLNHSRPRPYNRSSRGIIITTGNPPIRNTWTASYRLLAAPRRPSRGDLGSIGLVRPQGRLYKPPMDIEVRVIARFAIALVTAVGFTKAVYGSQRGFPDSTLNACRRTLSRESASKKLEGQNISVVANSSKNMVAR